MGYLLPESSFGRLRKITKKITVDGKRCRFVCIKVTILGEGITNEECAVATSQ
jgi:hypothetical protein